MNSSRASLHGSPGSEGRLLSPAAQESLARKLSGLSSLTVYPRSATAIDGGLLVAAREGQQRKILVSGKSAGFSGRPAEAGGEPLLVCDADAPNLQALRQRVRFLRPVLTGTTPSVGLGDRLGLATPGHIEAGKGSGFILVLAQQSIREMKRTGRTAQQVMDEAVFGVFQSGYDAGFGSDADHLKTPEDVDVTAAAGFTFFTIDPSEHVDDSVDRLAPAELAARYQRLIADGVPGAAGWRAKYLGQALQAGGLAVRFDEPALLKAAVKYGRAVAHTESLARHIARKAPVHELELSVDETALPTSVAEHLFIAHELRERGVRLISLAPRFVGDFEKGIDYKGDLRAFKAALEDHVQIARHYGPYKISVHSGSDKFLVYPEVARITQGLFHLKTAGTSYLEAIRVVARHDLRLLREIIAFARERFDTDKATYHISSSLAKVPPAEALKDQDLERIYLDENDGRQILHVTFGSVLTSTLGEGPAARPRFRQRLLALLNEQAGTYVEVLQRHIGRHIRGLQGKA